MPDQGMLVEGQFKTGGSICHPKMENRGCAFFRLPALGDFFDGIAALFPDKPGGLYFGAVEDYGRNNGLMNRGTHELLY